MASIQFYTDLNLNRNQIVNAVIENTTEDQATPAIGRLIFDTDIKALKYFDGTQWQISKARMSGLLVYKGAIPHDLNNEPDSPQTGDLYVFNSAGITNGFGAVEVQIGDYVVYDGIYWGWIVIQGNVISATTEIPGVVKIASNEEVLEGINAEKVTVPQYLSNWENQTDKVLRRKRVFENQTVNSSGLTLYHHIGKNNVTVDVYDYNGQKIYIDVEKGINNVILKTNVEITGIKIVISA
jgi:hypothetical protein